ncbi:hypothetical protein DPSP01_012172 [Paraphaeosphaeria sporulosa]
MSPYWPDVYILPSHPSITCIDRFSLIESPNDTGEDPPFWQLFITLLDTPVTSIPALLDVLETIAIERRGKAPQDYNTLASILRAREAAFLNVLWPAIANSALAMPNLFPSHSLPILGERTAKLELSRKQVACLVAHQFLGTLEEVPWQTGFHIFELWFAGEQVHARAPEVYIDSVLGYFGGIAEGDEDEGQEWKVSYEVVERSPCASASFSPFPARPGSQETDMGDISLLHMDGATNAPEYLGAGGNAVVVSANKFIGFGRSATQEEVLVGTTPAACPAVLVTPPLAAAQVLVVRGAETITRTVGMAREMRGCGPHKVYSAKVWRERAMLFMDALELDSFDGSIYPDVERANVEREMEKATTAFSSAKYSRVYTGLWGCRTFGGDPGVKITILWLAASVAASGLTVMYEDGREGFAESMGRFVELVREKRWTVRDLWDILLRAEGRGINKGGFLEWALTGGSG